MYTYILNKPNMYHLKTKSCDNSQLIMHTLYLFIYSDIFKYLKFIIRLQERLLHSLEQP